MIMDRSFLHLMRILFVGALMFCPTWVVGSQDEITTDLGSDKVAKKVEVAGRHAEIQLDARSLGSVFEMHLIKAPLIEGIPYEIGLKIDNQTEHDFFGLTVEEGGGCVQVAGLLGQNLSRDMSIDFRLKIRPPKGLAIWETLRIFGTRKVGDEQERTLICSIAVRARVLPPVQVDSSVYVGEGMRVAIRRNHGKSAIRVQEDGIRLRSDRFEVEGTHTQEDGEWISVGVRYKEGVEKLVENVDFVLDVPFTVDGHPDQTLVFSAPVTFIGAWPYRVSPSVIAFRKEATGDWTARVLLTDAHGEGNPVFGRVQFDLLALGVEDADGPVVLCERICDVDQAERIGNVLNLELKVSSEVVLKAKSCQGRIVVSLVPLWQRDETTPSAQVEDSYYYATYFLGW